MQPSDLAVSPDPLFPREGLACEFSRYALVCADQSKSIHVHTIGPGTGVCTNKLGTPGPCVLV